MIEAQHHYSDRIATAAAGPKPPQNAPAPELLANVMRGGKCKGGESSGKGTGFGGGKGKGGEVFDFDDAGGKKGGGKYRTLYPELSGYMERTAALVNAWREGDDLRMQCLLEDFEKMGPIHGARNRERRQRGLGPLEEA